MTPVPSCRQSDCCCWWGPCAYALVLCWLCLQGTQIQGNFWRESADKYYDSLEEGKVRAVAGRVGRVCKGLFLDPSWTCGSTSKRCTPADEHPPKQLQAHKRSRECKWRS